ncbi:MAG: hypothetical protein BWY75_03285 [bacterium ADurb.Bin425]|nr:MAG: hypothetical protein BWY75_03285 [bacterium ADurb.Bin425]
MVIEIRAARKAPLETVTESQAMKAEVSDSVSCQNGCPVIRASGAASMTGMLSTRVRIKVSEAERARICSGADL